MSDVTFTSDIAVELVRAHASDESVAWAARVSTLGDSSVDISDEKSNRGLINYLMRERHGSPFEHNSFTFRTSAPIFVWREHMRHRVGFSFNEESGRYRQLQPTFYVPARDRALVQVGKVGEYRFEDGSVEQHDVVESAIFENSIDSYDRYQAMLDMGVAREVARMVLPLNIFSTAYVTCNARSLMNFLSLRTKDESSTFPSYPQREIEMVAERYEAAFAEYMPIVHQAFCKNGRVAP